MIWPCRLAGCGSRRTRLPFALGIRKTTRNSFQQPFVPDVHRTLTSTVTIHDPAEGCEIRPMALIPL